MFTKILISGIFHVYVKLQVRLYKDYHEPFFIVRIKTFYEPIFNQCSLLCSQKTSTFDFLMFSVGVTGFKRNIGCKWVKYVSLFSPVCFRSNLPDMFYKIGNLQLGQRTLKKLYKSSFLVKIKDRLIMNSFIGISFL